MTDDFDQVKKESEEDTAATEETQQAEENTDSELSDENADSESNEETASDDIAQEEPQTDITQEEKTEKEPLKGWKKELLEWVESLGIAIVVALLIVNFIFTLVRVSGSSMEPTLQDHNNLFVLRLGYQPHNGDIIVFKPVGDPKKYYIKRIIATEGQEVDIKDNHVYVDGKELDEPYIQGTTYDRYNTEYPKTVPEDCVFAMGDNRENSRDSRDMIGVGMINKKTIVGKAWFRLFPFNKIGNLYK